jgi:hypothetical protein
MLTFENILTFVLGVVSGVLAGVILGISPTLWRWVWNKTPSRLFWQLKHRKGHPADPLYAVSLRDFDPSEHTLYVPTGDALALVEIDQSLERLYPEHKIDLYAQTDKPYRDWNKDVILIGGGLSNITTRCLLAALNPPLDARDHEHPDFNFKGLKDREGNVICDHEEGVTFTERNGTECLNMDWGYVIRAPDPRRQTKKIFVIVGGYTIGTHAAAQWVSQPSNLRWLWWQSGWQRLRNFLRLWSKSERADSLQVLLRVTVAPTEPSVTSTGIDADIEVWDQNTGCWNKKKRSKGKPLYFRTPESYADAYNCWADKACSKWRSNPQHSEY